jgi:hypothetical protein
VFDNVDDFDLLRQSLPVAEHGSVLITSRQVPGANSMEQVEVSVFPENEAESFMISLMKSNSDDDVDSPSDAETDGPLIRKLGEANTQEVHLSDWSSLTFTKIAVDTLGGLPLGIRNVVSYISQARCSVKEYLEIYEADYEGELYKRVDQSVDAVWYEHRLSNFQSMTDKRLKEDCPDALTLFNMLSCFDPDMIPLSILNPARGTDLGPQLEFLHNPVKRAEARRQLFRHNMIWETNGENGIRYHRLQMDIRVKQMEVTERCAAFTNALRLMWLSFPEKEDDLLELRELRPIADPLLIHALVLLKKATEDPNLEPGLTFAMLLDKVS